VKRLALNLENRVRFPDGGLPKPVASSLNR
jgi:hypothetical protein